MSEQEKASSAWDTWAIVEIMGKKKLAGRISEETHIGTTFLRVDVPEVGEHGAFTRFFSNSALYSITPCTEGIALRAAESLRARPITVYGVGMQAKQLEATARQFMLETDGEDDEWP